MTNAHSSPQHKILLAVAITAWLVLAIGLCYAWAFSRQTVGPKDVMSPRTFTSVLALFAGWVVALAGFIWSLPALRRPQRSFTSLAASVISGTYALPGLALLAFGAFFQ